MLDVVLDEDEIREKVIDFRAADSGKIGLTDAHIIVSGGRGVAADPSKGFEIVEELAETLGAALGASRGRSRRRLHSLQAPSGTDRQDSQAGPVHSLRDFRRNPAPRWNGQQQDYCRHQ